MPFSDRPPPFEVRVQHAGPAITLALVGELDLLTSGRLMEALATAIADGPEAIIVNLQELAFMDSSGLRCLLQARTLASDAGVRLAVLNGSGPAHRLLELSDLHSLIEMVNDPSQLDPPLQGST